MTSQSAVVAADERGLADRIPPLGAPVVGDEHPQVVVSAPALRLKYALSKGIAGVALVIASPFMLMIAALVRATMGRGVLYRQERVGEAGETFTILKFRTMLPDRRASRKPIEVEFDRRETHKTDADPRHTRVGRFLRKTSMDELPQLWNVVRGEMTLIGPRPELASVVDKYDLWEHPRHLVLPGITGLWQVSECRNELLHENLDLDVEYVRDLSLRNDALILLKTFSVFLRPTGS